MVWGGAAAEAVDWEPGWPPCHSAQGGSWPDPSFEVAPLGGDAWLLGPEVPGLEGGQAWMLSQPCDLGQWHAVCSANPRLRAPWERSFLRTGQPLVLPLVYLSCKFVPASWGNWGMK